MTTTHPITRHPRKRGDAFRQRVVCALLARAEAEESPFTTDELLATVGGSLTNLRHHLAWLEDRGVVQTRDALREVTRREVVLLNRSERAHREDSAYTGHST